MKTKGEVKTSILKSLRNNNYPSNYLTVLLEYLSIGILDKPEEEITKKQSEQLLKILIHLDNQKPVEYITGKATFYNHEFKITPDVLIPRSDTENLVETAVGIISSRKEAFTIIDIGTGSGCIIISLYDIFATKNYSFWAIDISEKALEIAKENAKNILGNNTIDFIKNDVVPQKIPTTSNVLIVTNPPYISDKNMKYLPKSVKEYEPDLALREDSQFIPKLQEYIDLLHSKNKNVYIAIEYSNKAGKMIQRFATPLKVSLQELLSA